MARKPTTSAGAARRAPAVKKIAPGVAVPETTAPLPPPVRKPIWTHLYFQVLVAIVAGAVIGHVWPAFGESLKPLGGETLLEKAGIDPTARPEQLSVVQFAALARALAP